MVDIPSNLWIYKDEIQKSVLGITWLGSILDYIHVNSDAKMHRGFPFFNAWVFKSIDIINMRTFIGNLSLIHSLLIRWKKLVFFQTHFPEEKNVDENNWVCKAFIEP